MRNLVKFTLILVTIAMVFPSCVSKKKFTELLSSKEAVDATLAQSQAKVKTLEGEKEELMEAKAGLEAQNADLSSQLASAQSNLEKASSELSTAKSSLSAAESKLSMAEKSIKGVFSGYEDTGLSVVTRDDRLYVVLSEPITFRSGSTRIPRSKRGPIHALAEVLKNNPNISIQVEGHSDNAKFNQGMGNNWSLSMNRAMSALNILLRDGVPPNQLSAVGRGEFAPAVSDNPSSAEARAQNRRVEFLIVPKISSLSDMINT